jgi:hypothetical protein
LTILLPHTATPSHVLFGAPASLLPQETYCAFSVVWPRGSVCADEPITPTTVAVFTRDQTRADIARAVVAKPRYAPLTQPRLSGNAT